MTKLKFGRHTSEKKAIRKNRKKEKVNKFLKDKIHFLSRKLRTEISKKKLDAAKTTLNELSSQCDKAVKIGVFHKNNIARKKSRFAKLLLQAAK